MTLALIATALMTAGVASYNLAFVALMKQGEWYMPVGVLFVTLSLYDLAKRYAPVRPRRSAMTRRALAAVLILANLAVPAALLGRNDFIYERIYADAADVAEHFAGEDVRLLSYVDGIFGFGTRLPVMSGLLFTVDPEAVRLFRDEGLSVLEIAYERGFFHIPLINLEPDIFHEGMTREEVERALMERTGVFTISFPAPWRPLPFGFDLEYLHPDGHLAVVKMAPRAGAE